MLIHDSGLSSVSVWKLWHLSVHGQPHTIRSSLRGKMWWKNQGQSPAVVHWAGGEHSMGYVAHAVARPAAVVP